MEEKTQELLFALQEAEKILTKIKIVTEEKKLMNQKIKSTTDLLNELKKNISDINTKYSEEEKQIIELIERIRDIKINVIENDIESLANIIISNLPNGLNKELNGDNKGYKIVLYNNNQYIGAISLYMDEELIADMKFDNSEEDKKVIIKDIFRIYSVINYVNMIISYGD
jgi:hypothetical protein